MDKYPSRTLPPLSLPFCSLTPITLLPFPSVHSPARPSIAPLTSLLSLLFPILSFPFQGRIQEFPKGGAGPFSSPSLFSFPFPSRPLPFPSRPFPSPSSPVPSPPLPLRSRAPLSPAPPAGSGAEPRPKTNLVHSKAVRKPLVAIILSILKCMFYSRTIKM